MHQNSLDKRKVLVQRVALIQVIDHTNSEMISNFMQTHKLGCYLGGMYLNVIFVIQRNNYKTSIS